VKTVKPELTNQKIYETVEYTPDTPVSQCSIVLLSYNRPRMLGEAIESVLNNGYEQFNCYVLDDDSDFDVEGLVKSYGDERLWLAQCRYEPGEIRLSNLASNINAVLGVIPRNEAVLYLCDDDIMARHWPAKVLTVFNMPERPHLIQGNLHSFEDGKDWRTESVVGLKGTPLPQGSLWWTTGTFAHLSDCYHDEGLSWKETRTGHSQDYNFIEEAIGMHPNYFGTPDVAVYRREHPKTLNRILGRSDDGMVYDLDFHEEIDRLKLRGMME
jgi:hypothetical protein